MQFCTLAQKLGFRQGSSIEYMFVEDDVYWYTVDSVGGTGGTGSISVVAQTELDVLKAINIDQVIVFTYPTI